MGKRRASGAEGRRNRGPVVAVCVTLAVCLLLTGGVVLLVNRVSDAFNEWSPPGASDVEPPVGTIQTPPPGELTGPPELSEVSPVDEGPEADRTGADERSTPAAPHPSAAWLDRVAESTGIPRRALEAYASAQLVLAREQPGCRLSWPTLAGIGYVETHHGTYAGGEIGSDGVTTVDIIGIPLDGTNQTRAIPDTDGGRYDGDAQWDRAIGPMQFIPHTWAQWGDSLSGDDPDPHDIDDAALAAGRYLCAEDRDLTVAADWESAILTYNRSSTYVADVLAYAHAYADAA
ncbi:murein transglycosylase [Nocardiopsis sinuspersici]|uniref:murein transglycosylase n=1 Tax=Nocardiopsis sinuspersici TaxID=501010 RepID=UPI0015C846C3|nr:murein transglycosylase [Nocardiopsis sinuspersici]